jgi:hypothetical protein
VRKWQSLTRSKCAITWHLITLSWYENIHRDDSGFQFEPKEFEQSLDLAECMVPCTSCLSHKHILTPNKTDVDKNVPSSETFCHLSNEHEQFVGRTALKRISTRIGKPKSHRLTATSTGNIKSHGTTLVICVLVRARRWHDGCCNCAKWLNLSYRCYHLTAIVLFRSSGRSVTFWAAADYQTASCMWHFFWFWLFLIPNTTKMSVLIHALLWQTKRIYKVNLTHALQRHDI